MNKLYKSTAIVSISTMLSRTAGLARDVFIANIFGSKDVADAFFIAFKIPNLFRALFAEGAFSQAFIPLLADVKKEGNRQIITAFIAKISGLLALVLLIFIGLVIIWPTSLTYILAYGFIDDIAKFQLTSELIRITIVYLFLISLAGLYGAVLNSYGRFLLPAASPIFLNLSFILFAINAWQFSPEIKALAYACICGGAIQLAMQLYGVSRLGLLKPPKISFKDKKVREFGRLILPGIYGVAVLQINTFIDTLIATFLVSGSVSWYYYSNRLVALPVGIFGVAIATVVMPKLSALRVQNDSQEFVKTFSWGIKMTCSIAFPATVALLILSEPLIFTIYAHGAIAEFDVEMIYYCTLALTVGILGFMFVKIFSSVFYSHKDIKTPVKVTTFCVVLNILCNFAIAIPMHYYWQIGHVGLAIATTISVICNNILLFVILVKRGWYRPPTRAVIITILWRLASATLLMAIVLYLMNSQIGSFSQLEILQRIGYLCLLVGVGFIVYALSFYWLLWRKQYFVWVR